MDRAYVTAWLLESGGMCPCGCGQPAAESMARENQFAYGAEVIRCHARAAMDRQADAYKKQEGADTAGLQVRLVRGPGWERPEGR